MCTSFQPGFAFQQQLVPGMRPGGPHMPNYYVPVVQQGQQGPRPGIRRGAGAQGQQPVPPFQQQVFSHQNSTVNSDFGWLGCYFQWKMVNMAGNVIHLDCWPVMVQSFVVLSFHHASFLSAHHLCGVLWMGQFWLLIHGGK